MKIERPLRGPFFFWPVSVMRWRFVRRTSRIAFGVLQALFQFTQLTRHRINLLPLRRDRLVQRLDGLVLIGQAHFQSVDALA